ncbi:5'-flap endonuclease [Pestalotiopsis sp. 9143b]|nr:5'-flap endonuclease [Pestalotiopsis sp. 9143b]
MSSPAKGTRYDAYVVRSSSPDLPSLGEIFKKSPRKAPPLRSGSNATTIPAAARTTFTSAAEILREAPEIDIDTEEITHSPPRKAKPPRKPRAKSQKAKDAIVVEDEAGVILSPKRFKSQPKSQPKSRTKAPTTLDDIPSGQTAAPRNRVTKATTTNKSKAKKKKTEAVSRHFASVEKADTEKDPINDGELEKPPQPLEPALARRIDWTPPRAISAPVVLDSDDHRELLSSAEKAEASKDVFQNLLDDFGHKDKDSNARENMEPSEKPEGNLKKRKRLELVSTTEDKGEDQPKPAKEASPTKAPAIKKKPRTLTELATAPYAPAEYSDVDLLAPGTKDSLLRYFDTDGHVTALVENQSITMDRNNTNPKKKPAKPRKKKGATVEDPILLSPNSALKQSTAQDFVFGTSSQLMLEESPRTLRNLQAAIKASMQDDHFASSPVVKAAKRMGLWHAGARDTDGDLLEAEAIELIGEKEEAIVTQMASATDSAVQPDFPDVSDLLSSSPQAAKAPIDPKSHFWQSQKNIDRASEDAATSASEPPPSSQQPSMNKETAGVSSPRPNYDLFTDAQLAKQIKTFGFKPVKRRTAMVALLDQCWLSKHPNALPASSAVGGSASMSTSAVLKSPRKFDSAAPAVEVETTKKPRGRPKKDKSVLPVEPEVVSPKRGPGRPRKTSIDSTDMSPRRGPGRPRKTSIDSINVSPKRGRGRPRKTSVDSADAEGAEKMPPPRQRKTSKKEKEIQDSEEDDSLSLSPQSRPESVFSSPPPIDLSTLEEGDTTLNLDPTEQEADMFVHITKAVISAPRSNDPNEPSWHEKMLLYDPVVLEELTTWLNEGQLTRVGYDGEVSTTEVKKWCESKSVICLWKANTRGKERKRY